MINQIFSVFRYFQLTLGQTVTDVWSSGRMVKRTYGQTDVWSNGRMVKRTYGQTDVWSNRRMVKRTYGQTDVFAEIIFLATALGSEFLNPTLDST
jgi:hypothetical protein